jgi:pimeloyl-ACP methyl ester carboxylesterase
VALVDHARTGPDNFEGDNPEVAQKANTLLKVVEQMGAEKVDVIAHSEGALNAILAAKLYPEKFRNIVLVAPAGLIGKDSVPRLSGRFMAKVARGYLVDMKEIKQRDAESAERFAKSGPTYINANKAKALREVKAIAKTQIKDTDLDELREKGINIGVLQSNKDYGFPQKRIGKQLIKQAAAPEQDLIMSVDAYASVAAKNAGHDDLIIHPERGTRAALQMLSELDKID